MLAFRVARHAKEARVAFLASSIAIELPVGVSGVLPKRGHRAHRTPDASSAHLAWPSAVRERRWIQARRNVQGHSVERRATIHGGAQQALAADTGPRRHWLRERYTAPCGPAQLKRGPLGGRKRRAPRSRMPSIVGMDESVPVDTFEQIINQALEQKHADSPGDLLAAQIAFHGWSPSAFSGLPGPRSVSRRSAFKVSLSHH